MDQKDSAAAAAGSSEGQVQELGKKVMRRAYLITYSQADLSIVPNCERFAEIVEMAVRPARVRSATPQKLIECYAVCMEKHQEGNKHFHLSIKLTQPKKWYSMKNNILRVNGISVHFSSKHLGYVACYRYVRKNKPKSCVIHSPGHPNLDVIGPQRTNQAIVQNNRNAEERRSVGNQSSVSFSGDQEQEQNSSEVVEVVERPVKVKRLSNSDVADFILDNNIKTEVELMNESNRRKSSGERDLYEFILRKNPRALSDLISTTWRIQGAEDELDRRAVNCMDVIMRHSGECKTEGCDGKWLVAAREVLQLNQINSYVFADALRSAFRRGRDKFNNIFLYGGTNRGKSFLLSPIEILFKAFVSPSSARYAWIGIKGCEVAFLNDYRWSAEAISWADLLLLLEGATVHLPRPKNLYATDLCIHHSNRLPIFATGKAPIVKSDRASDKLENEMMESRWDFEFTYRIPDAEIRKIPPCKNCFCNLVLLGMEQ